MTLPTRWLPSTRSRAVARPLIGLAVAVLLVPTSLLLTSSAGAAAVAVPRLTTTRFWVLAGSGITNTGPTTIKGEIGTFPTTTITGAGSLTLTGTNHAGDSVTQQAKTDLV